MAYVFIDGFDKYGSIDTQAGFYGAAGLISLMLGDWTSVDAPGNFFPSVVAPLSSNGQALKLIWTNDTGPHGIYRTIGAVSRVIGGYRFSDNIAGTLFAGLSYLNNTTAAFTIWTDGSGRINISTGGLSGTILATSLTAVGANTTHYLEWDVTIGASASYQVWLDGVSVLSGSGNTGNGQSTVNNFTIRGGGSGSTHTLTVDDLYLFDSTTAVNNAVLNTNPVVDTQFATSDNQTQWTFSQGSLGKAYSLFGGTSGVALPGANQLALLKFTPGQNCTLQSVSLMPAGTSAGAKMKGVVYSDNAGSPNTLLSSGTEVVGVANGTLVTLPLVTPQALTSGTAYWVGLITDTQLTLAESDSGTLGQNAANTYTSGAPASAPAMTSGRPDWLIWGNLTGVASANSSAVKQNPAPQPVGSDVSYISSSTVNQEDLYAFHALSITPTSISVSVVKAFCRNSDAGARTVTLQMKSAAVDSPSSAQTPAQSYQWLQSPYPTDPNTSAAWTSANLNAALSGIKIAS